MGALGAPDRGIELDPAYSFQSGLTQPQIALLNSALAGAGTATLLNPGLVIWSLSHLLCALFFSFVFWRAFLIVIGLTQRRASHARAACPDAALPIYSILIPVYREAAVIPQLAGALRALNWPRDRLDIQLLIEADDAETLVAAQRERFPIGSRLSIVPPIGPRTKPNALKHGLNQARGTLLTIYDAEDLPHPDQLQAAYEAFQALPRTTVCLQSPLIADNADQNWLSAHWALEYDVQFGLLLPGLTRMQMPVLLGGTSNHFRVEALHALGGWDAWNVTEDADLGLRIARAGLQCAMLDLPTYEDAPTDLEIWTAQRSRWVKGFIQTWFVLMRAPRTALRELGSLKFIAANLSLGTAILAPSYLRRAWSLFCSRSLQTP